MGGGGLGVGLTGPTGGPGAAEAGVRLLGAIWANKGWPLDTMARMGSLRSFEVSAGATCCRQKSRAATASLGRFDFSRDSSFKGPCRITGILRWR